MKPLKFADLPVGAYFRWQTRFGAQNTFYKVSEQSILTAAQKRKRPNLLADCYFAADPVTIVQQP